jgi:molybdate transport system substrate-binding protein
LRQPSPAGAGAASDLDPHAPLQLFCAVALKRAMQGAILPAFTRASGTAVNAVFEPTNILLKRIEGGARPDVVVGVGRSLEAAAAKGMVDADSLRPVAKSGIGVAVAPGVIPPDISSVEALIIALVNARSVAYSSHGPSGAYFSDLLQHLGIAERIEPSATLIDHGPTAIALLDDRADLAIHQMSELLLVPEAKIVGPFPDAVQHYTGFSAGLVCASADHLWASALANFMCGATANSAYTVAGLQGAKLP